MTTPGSVTLYFDPGCPWTWQTSRWLDEVTGRHGTILRFDAFELADAAPLDQVPGEYRGSAAASRSFLRAVVAAHDAGRDDLTGVAYTDYGTRVHKDHITPSPELVTQAWSNAGGEPYLAALDDVSLDRRVAASRAQAVDLAGDDIGSPVVAFETSGGTRGFFGPIVAPAPRGADADQLWSALISAGELAQFFELKTRRTAAP